MFRRGPSLREASQMGQSLVERQNVSILGVDIEQVGLVRRLMTIADAVPHDDCAKLVLNRIDGARADATARRASAENNGVNPLRMKRWRKAGAKECAGILLGDDKLARRGLDTITELGERAIWHQSGHHRRLLQPNSTIEAVRRTIEDVGVDNGNALTTRRLEKQRRPCDRFDHAGREQRRVWR